MDSVAVEAPILRDHREVETCQHEEGPGETICESTSLLQQRSRDFGDVDIMGPPLRRAATVKWPSKAWKKRYMGCMGRARKETQALGGGQKIVSERVSPRYWTLSYLYYFSVDLLYSDCVCACFFPLQIRKYLICFCLLQESTVEIFRIFFLLL